VSVGRGREVWLLRRRARIALGTATQCTRIKVRPPVDCERGGTVLIPHLSLGGQPARILHICGLVRERVCQLRAGWMFVS
jgi:hypothetical protein